MAMENRPRPRRKLLIGVAGAATVVAALAIAVGPGRAPIAPLPSGSAGTAAEGSPAATAGLLPMGPLAGAAIPARDPVPWTAVDWREVPRAFGAKLDRALDRMDGLIAADRGLIGWGRMAIPGRNQFNDMGAVYLSADGIGWRTIPIDVGVGRADTSEFQRVADGPAGIVVVGGVCCTDEEQPALWRSADAIGWERLPWPETFGAGAVISTLVGTGTGYIAGGTAEGSATLW